MNIVLIGYRGTGKTTVARLLGEYLGWPTLDADDELERAAGQSIAEIFAAGGEAAFRAHERDTVARLTALDGHVLALGGGAVVDPPNRAAVRKTSKIVWLSATPETICQRLDSDSTSRARRPNLTSTGGIAEIIALVGQRTPIYRECADLEVDTEGKTPQELAAEIVERLALGPSRAR